MSKTFRAWKIDEPLFLPATVGDFVAQDHLARFVLSLVRDDIDLAEVTGTYGSERGQPPYDPIMMTALLLYSYCCGIYSSRRIARACRERVDFMSIVGFDALGAPNPVSASKPQPSTTAQAGPKPAAAPTRVEAMRAKLKAGGHASPYRLRKQLPEPVFGQIKQARGFRQFLLRGFQNVCAEWAMVCTAHNLLKLAQGWSPSAALPRTA